MSDHAGEVSMAITALEAGAMTVGTLRAELAGRFSHIAPSDADAEARDLIAAVLDAPRLWPTVNAGTALDTDTVQRIARAAARRARGMPFAYAVGRAAFRHLTLAVDERVLIPRQETEQLVQEILHAELRAGGIAVDVGTGSGAIALALATEGAFDRVIATDVSRGALLVAEGNVASLADRLRCPVELRHGSLLAPVRDIFGARLIVSNPPYIAHAEAQALPASVRDWEPPLALFSGGDGLMATRAIIRGAAAQLEPGGLLALEVDERRASLAAECAASDDRYTDVRIRLDLAGRERFLLATRT